MSRRGAAVTIELPTAGAIMLALEYVVTGAAWTPCYDARLSSEGDRLDWAYHAQVSQSSGEHWDDVRLSLSTAEPAVGSAPPTLGEWVLRSPMPLMRSMAPPGAPPPAPIRKKEAADEAFEEEARAYEPLASFAPIAVVSQGLSVTLQTARPVSLPSNGEPRQVPIGQIALTPELKHLTIPRLVPQAFLDLALKNQGPWPLLPGPIKAFVGQDYVGTPQLSEVVLPGQAFSVSMGPDRTLQVQRKRTKKLRGEGGMIQKHRFWEYAYELTITNHQSVPRQLTVIEPVPQAGHAEVKIKHGVEQGPAPAEAADKLTWSLAIAPSAPVTIQWGYRVEHPLSLDLAGLE